MRHDEVPHDRLQTFGLRRDQAGIDRRDDDARIREPGERATVASGDTDECGAAFACQLHRLDEVHADTAVDVAAADGEDEHAVGRAEARRAEPVGVGAVPAVVVDARGQLRHVVGNRIRLDVTELAEVARRV